MQTGRTNLRSIPEVEGEDAAPAFVAPEAQAALAASAAATAERERRATEMMYAALKALSQRALIAASSLVDLVLVASVFALWLQVIASPSQLQLVAVGMYALFIGAALLARKRKA